MRWLRGIKVRYYREQCRANYVSMPSLKPQYPGGGLGPKLLGLELLGPVWAGTVWAGMPKCQPRICHLSYAAMPES